MTLVFTFFQFPLLTPVFSSLKKEKNINNYIGGYGLHLEVCRISKIISYRIFPTVHTNQMWQVLMVIKFHTPQTLNISNICTDYQKINNDAYRV